MTHIVDSLNVEGDASYRVLKPVKAETPSTLNGVLTLTETSSLYQVITGTATGFVVKLPVATTVVGSIKFEIHNVSSQNIEVRAADGTTVIAFLYPGSYSSVVLRDNTTSNGVWTAVRIDTSAVALSTRVRSVYSSVNTTTNSTSFVDLNLMTLTPDIPSVYVVTFECVASNSNNGVYSYFVININGVDVADSVRQVGFSGGVSQTFFYKTVLEVLAGQIVKVRWRVSGGTGTVAARTLILERN